MADAWDPFLNGIAFLESGYNPTATNPRSSATGAFQFLNGTARDAMRMGLPNPQQGDFGSQKKTTQAFIRKTNPRAAEALDAGDVNTAIALLRPTWPSLPGGSQPQNPSQYAKFQQVLQGGGPQPPGGQPVPPPTDPQYGQGIPPPPTGPSQTPPVGQPQATFPGGTGQSSLDLIRQSQSSAPPTPGYNPMQSDWGSALMQAGAALGSTGPGGAALASLANQNRANMLEQQKLGMGETKVLDDGTVVKIMPDGKVVPVYQGAQKMEKMTDEDMFGNKTNYGWNPYTGVKTTLPGGTPDDQKITPELINSIYNARAGGASVQDALKMAPPYLRNVVERVLNGDEIPQNFGYGSKARGGLIMLASAVDKDFTENTYQERKTIMNDYARTNANTFGGSVKSLGTFGEHLGTVGDAFQDLWNKGRAFDGNLIVWNQATKAWEAATGHPEYARIANEVNTYATEKDRFQSGKPATDEGRYNAGKVLLATGSPDQIKAVLAGDARMVIERQEQNAAQWSSIMKGSAQEKGPLVYDDGSRGFVPKKSLAQIERLRALDPINAPGGGNLPMSPMGSPAAVPPANGRKPLTDIFK